MNNNTPLISVVMITYQHEKYIAEAIQSVLEQTFERFELVVVNDGSTDKTDEIIRSFQDNRISYIRQENQGPSAASNNGILAARGKYIALMSGDDVCHPQRLELQHQFINNTDKKIVFSWVDFINDDSQPVKGRHFAEGFFNHPNRNRTEILKHFFMKGNYLCAITAFIDKEILLESGLFNPASIQLQDFDMWIKLVKKHDLYLIEDRLVKYRILSESNNLSANPDNRIRCLFEHHQIQKSILDNLSPQLFKSSFAEWIKAPDFQEGHEYELEKAFLHLNHSHKLFQSIGAEKLFHLLQNKEVLLTAKAKYNFGLPELFNLTKEMDITNIRIQSQLYGTQTELARSQAELSRSQAELAGMKSSNFWNLRKICHKINNIFGS